MKTCPICSATFNHQIDMFSHFVREHKAQTKGILSIRNVEDIGYFMSCLVASQENLETERWYNS